MTSEADTSEPVIVRISPRENDAPTDSPQAADWEDRAKAIWHACHVTPASYTDARSFVAYIMELATGRKKGGLHQRPKPPVETNDE